jgi:hypothetical protein
MTDPKYAVIQNALKKLGRRIKWWTKTVAV